MVSFGSNFKAQIGLFSFEDSHKNRLVTQRLKITDLFAKSLKSGGSAVISCSA